MAEVKEPSLQEMLQNLLTNSELHDVYLEGEDGMRVGGNRRLLAARSGVFEKMLVGPYREGSTDVVKIGYPGSVLNAIVEYIHTDSSSILQLESISTDTETIIQTLVSLAGAGTYFNLPGLREKTHEFLQACLRKIPSLSFSLLQSCKQEGPSAPKKFEMLALSTIQSKANECVETSSVAILDPTVLEEILENKKLRINEYQLFRLLKTWATGGDDHTPAKADTASNLASKSCDRLHIASDLSKHIHLECIEPSLLSLSVASSGLVSPERLANAYALQALAAEKVHRISFNRTTQMSLPVWKASRSEVIGATHSSQKFYFLKMPLVRENEHKWTIRIEKICSLIWIGVARLHEEASTGYRKFVGFSQDGYLFNGNVNPDPYEAKDWSTAPPSFVQGDEVTLTLNLVPTEEGNGTLSASVDGGESIKIFSDLRCYLDGDKNGFTPAVSMEAPGQVRIVDFQSLNH